ncbi:MAG: phenylalanine--tRNA ligase beta subunit-related protein [Solirubrobacteraceae bacterium]
MADSSFEVRVDPAVHAAHPRLRRARLGGVGLGQSPPDAGSDAQLTAAESHLRANVRHVVPLGGEDADRLQGALRLTVAAGDEPFDPRGDGTDVEHAATGEFVWRGDRGVTCRRWNWRQGRRTQLTDDTTRAFSI